MDGHAHYVPSNDLCLQNKTGLIESREFDFGRVDVIIKLSFPSSRWEASSFAWISVLYYMIPSQLEESCGKLILVAGPVKAWKHDDFR
jgi:hypothetical protein